MAIKISNSTIIDDSRNIINAGIVTASYYYGDASNLSKNFPLVSNVLYVAKNGNDANPGTRLSEPKATIAGAVAAAKTSGTTAGTVIKVSAGTYIENNPIALPDQVSIVGDSLREVSITPENDGDLFYVGTGNYIAEMSFIGAANRGAVVSFNPNDQRYINQSPYIQNCTNFIPNSIGLRIDGKNALGPLKSMVLDSYTQYNQGGIGCSITNEGYAQLVSMFTICNDVAVYCGSGGACDLTNSNSSFGNYGFVADGVSPLKYTGINTSYASANSDTFELNLSTPTLSITNASYDNVSGILTAYTSTAHNFSVGMGVSIVGLGFTCPYEPGRRLYPSGQKGYIFEIKTVAPGRYVDSYNLIQANRTEIVDKSLAAIAISYPDFYFPGDPQTTQYSRFYDSYRLIQKNKSVIVNSTWTQVSAAYPGISTTQNKCKRDLGYFVDAISTDIFTGGNSYIIAFTKKYFTGAGVPISNGLVGEETESVYAFNYAAGLMKNAITNTLVGAAYSDLTLTVDPDIRSNTSPSSCANVQSAIDTLTAIATQAISGGNLSTLNSITINNGIFDVGESKCRRDIGYVVDAISLDVRDYTNRNIIAATKAYFDANGSPISNGLVGEENPSIVGFSSVGYYCKQAITNQLNVRDLTIAADPVTGFNTDPLSCANVRTNIDNLVGIITTFIGQGNLTGLPAVSTASTVFTMNVGVATQPHTYVPNTGTAKINVVRPFDGQSVYFGDLYNSVGKIIVGSGGTGYVATPKIIIDRPSVSWGIQATAVAEVKNGSITAINIISNGRGYTTPPSITVSTPNVGVNTAILTTELLPTYYFVQNSTPISSGISTIVITENVPYPVGVGTVISFFKQSRVLASGHSFEYIGSGTEISKCLPSTGGVPIQDNEVHMRNGGLVVYTSTDQTGNFRIGDGVVINQQTGTVSGASYTKSLFANVTPFILALGGGR
jgi:hypothetical protein